MQSKAATTDQYLAELPSDRRGPIEAICNAIRDAVPPGVEEVMSYGMIGFVIPHSLYPNGYHCDPKLPLPFINIASQKNHMAIYLFCLYVDQEAKARFLREYAASGKKLKDEKSCIRFTKLEDIPLDVIANAIRRISLAEFIELYEKSIPPKIAEKIAKQNAKNGIATQTASKVVTVKNVKASVLTKKTGTSTASKATVKKKTSSVNASPKKATKKVTAKKPIANKKVAKKTSVKKKAKK